MMFFHCKNRHEETHTRSRGGTSLERHNTVIKKLIGKVFSLSFISSENRHSNHSTQTIRSSEFFRHLFRDRFKIRFKASMKLHDFSILTQVTTIDNFIDDELRSSDLRR